MSSKLAVKVLTEINKQIQTLAGPIHAQLKVLLLQKYKNYKNCALVLCWIVIHFHCQMYLSLTLKLHIILSTAFI